MYIYIYIFRAQIYSPLSCHEINSISSLLYTHTHTHTHTQKKEKEREKKERYSQYGMQQWMCMLPHSSFLGMIFIFIISSVTIPDWIKPQFELSFYVMMMTLFCT
jgi:hypothetical protein